MRELHREDPSYPKKLILAGAAPETLYLRGRLPDEKAPSVAIVGARLCSAYGRRAAYDFGYELAKRGVQVISGMATGIDGSAQEGALDAGGYSCGVLGCGADICYPKGNRALYARLLSHGGIVTEYPPGTEPVNFHFPARNRIISALSDIVLVVEARERSGSLITVDFALSQGKTVYAVPGRVGDPLSDGCNRLIAQGAGIAYAPEAILAELKLMRDTVSYAESLDFVARFRRATERRVLSSETLSDAAKRVFRALLWEDALSPDALSERTNLPLPEVRAALSALCREQLAAERGRDSYHRARMLPAGGTDGKTD